MSIYDGTVSPTRGNGFVIGACDRINGAGAEPSGFIVTKHELEQVARYWFRERLDNAFFCFKYQQSGSLEWRLSVYSEDRLNACAELLGKERMTAIEDEVVTEFQKSVDPTAWRTFTSPELRSFFDDWWINEQKVTENDAEF